MTRTRSSSFFQRPVVYPPLRWLFIFIVSLAGKQIATIDRPLKILNILIHCLLPLFIYLYHGNGKVLPDSLIAAMKIDTLVTIEALWSRPLIVCGKIDLNEEVELGSVITGVNGWWNANF